MNQNDFKKMNDDERRIILLGDPHDYQIWGLIQTYEDLEDLLKIGLEMEKKGKEVWYTIAMKLTDLSEFPYREGIRHFDYHSLYDKIDSGLIIKIYKEVDHTMMKLWSITALQEENIVLQFLKETDRVDIMKNGLKNIHNPKHLAELKMIHRDPQILREISKRSTQLRE